MSQVHVECSFFRPKTSWLWANVNVSWPVVSQIRCWISWNFWKNDLQSPQAVENKKSNSKLPFVQTNFPSAGISTVNDGWATTKGPFKSIKENWYWGKLKIHISKRTTGSLSGLISCCSIGAGKKVMMNPGPGLERCYNYNICWALRRVWSLIAATNIQPH